MNKSYHTYMNAISTYEYTVHDIQVRPLNASCRTHMDSFHTHTYYSHMSTHSIEGARHIYECLMSKTTRITSILFTHTCTPCEHTVHEPSTYLFRTHHAHGLIQTSHVPHLNTNYAYEYTVHEIHTES